jgi:hypothetical protein
MSKGALNLKITPGLIMLILFVYVDLVVVEVEFVKVVLVVVKG